MGVIGVDRDLEALAGKCGVTDFHAAAMSYQTTHGEGWKAHFQRDLRARLVEQLADSELTDLAAQAGETPETVYDALREPGGRAALVTRLQAVVEAEA